MEHGGEGGEMKAKEDLCFFILACTTPWKSRTSCGGYLDPSIRRDFNQLKGIHATLDKMFKVGPHICDFCCVSF